MEYTVDAIVNNKVVIRNKAPIKAELMYNPLPLSKSICTKCWNKHFCLYLRPERLHKINPDESYRRYFLQCDSICMMCGKTSHVPLEESVVMDYNNKIKAFRKDVKDKYEEEEFKNKLEMEELQKLERGQRRMRLLAEKREMIIQAKLNL